MAFLGPQFRVNPIRLSILVVLLIVSCLAVMPAFGQSTPPQSDPQALAIATQSITALTGGTSVVDVTLTGTAIWSVASQNETANATLMAKGTAESRFDMSLSGGQRSEVRNDGSSGALGELIAPGGSVVEWGLQNCLVSGVWFFPQLSVLGAIGDPSLIFAYVGQESRNGIAVQHIQSYRWSASNTTNVRQQSTMDIYLDAVSYLPTAFAFNIYLDDSASQSLPVEIDFSGYQPANGVQVASRIQRYVGGNLGFDFSVTGVQLNSGLSDSLFAIQ